MLEPTPPSSIETATAAHVGRLFEKYSRMVYALCCLVLRDRSEAEDATQQTFLAAYRSLLRGTEPRDPAAWLAVIARNECRGWFRKRPPEPRSLSDAEDSGSRDPASLAGQREEIAVLRETLAELPQHQRDAFILREFCGLSYREIAAAVGRSRPAVEGMVFSCRRRLRERLTVVREAANGLAVPLALQDWLANAIPGFSGAPTGSAAAGASAGGIALAKLVSPSLVAKLSAGLLAVGTATSLTAVETQRHPRLVVQPAPQGRRSPARAERSSPSVVHRVRWRRVGRAGRRVPAVARPSGSSRRKVLPPAHVSPTYESRKDARTERETEGGSPSAPGETSVPPSSRPPRARTTSETRKSEETERPEERTEQERPDPPQASGPSEDDDETEGGSPSAPGETSGHPSQPGDD